MEPKDVHSNFDVTMKLSKTGSVGTLEVQLTSAT